MIDILFITIGLLLALVCITDWRKGVFICIIAGFLQDPLRKLIEGEPFYLTVIVAAYLGLTFLGAKMKKKRLTASALPLWDSAFRRLLLLFISLVLIQSIFAFMKTGSPAIAGLGLISYFSPIPALLIAFHAVRSNEDIIRIIRFYVIFAVVAMTGIYLSYMGYTWDVLRQVGGGIMAYSPSGEPLELHTGFLRAPETAAWHGATAACFIVVMFISRRGRLFSGLISGAIIIFLITAVILTGRRKALVEIILFVSFYGFLLVYFRRGAFKLAFLILTLGIVFAFISSSYLFPDEVTTGINPYYQRSISAKEDAFERIYNMSVGSVRWIIAQNGFLGSGAGTGSQGAQHFGGAITGGAAEGGIGKVLAEIGVPGLTLFLWVAVKIFKYFWKLIKQFSRGDPYHARLMYGIISLLAANSAVFVTAHQVFGDPFVLLVIGWVLGFAFALPALREMKDLKRPNAQVTRRNLFPGKIPFRPAR